MKSVHLLDSSTFVVPHSIDVRLLYRHHHSTCIIPYSGLLSSSLSQRRRRRLRPEECSVSNYRRVVSLPAFAADSARTKTYTVGDFMTKKKDLYVVKKTTAVEEAWEVLVNKGITGFPVINDNWELVGVVSDYDLLALDSISGGVETSTNYFPDINSSWNTFNEIQKLLSKTNGKVIGDLMSRDPLFVHESTNLGEAARLLLENKFRRLPVVDGCGKLVGIITRGNIVRAALQIKRATQNSV